MFVRRLTLIATVAVLLLGGDLATIWAQNPKPKPKPAGGGTAKRAPAAPTATLLIKSDMTALVSMDGEPIKKRGNEPAAIQPDEIVRHPVPLGEHIIEAVTLDGLDKWHEVLAVDKVGQRVVVVELERVREARVDKSDRSKERQAANAAQIQRDAEDKAKNEQRERERRIDDRRKADAERIEKERAEQKEADLDQRARALRSQISQLESAADRADRRADDSRQAAEQAEREAERYAASGNAVSASLSRTTASFARNAERNAKQEANDARTKVRALERDLSSLR